LEKIMDANRKAWNEQQQRLLKALERADHGAVQTLFARHHAMVHSEKMSGMGVWSFEDEVLEGVNEALFRRIPSGAEHSIVWNLWHIARIEDVTMNLLLAGSDQLYFSEGWFERMNLPFRHAGNAMNAPEMATLSARIHIEALRAYRVAVGRRTRQIVAGLNAADYKRRVDASRLERVMVEGAVTESACEIVAYWGKRDLAGLLLMPATRHNFLHLNECLRLKAKRA
jgi:hypothetical protein